jgi:RNA polymerase sigma-70 factor (ECF subfamily)
MKLEMTRAAARLAGLTYRQYSAALHRYLVRRLPRAQDADDLSQEVFMRLLRLEEAQLVRQPQNYLYGIAANVVREYLMRSELEHQRMAYDSELLDKEAEQPFELPPDELADRIDATRRLHAALAKLSPMHRAVVLCLKREGMSYEETARATGLTYWTVEKYYFQAKAQLKSMRWDE